MFSTHNNVCRYFTIALTTPKPFSMHKTHTLLTLFWQGPGVPQAVRMLLQISRTIHRHIKLSPMILLIVIATNQYKTCHIQYTVFKKKWIKFTKFFTHYCHFPWPVDFWAVCLHHFLEGTLDEALEGALNAAL